MRDARMAAFTTSPLQMPAPPCDPQAYNPHTCGQPRFSPTRCFRRRTRTPRATGHLDAPTETTLFVVRTLLERRGRQRRRVLADMGFLNHAGRGEAGHPCTPRADGLLEQPRLDCVRGKLRGSALPSTAVGFRLVGVRGRARLEGTQPLGYVGTGGAC